jgi:hypothetical protein
LSSLDAVREGLDRDDIEEALGADLEFFMFRAVTNVTLLGDAGLAPEGTCS